MSGRIMGFDVHEIAAACELAMRRMDAVAGNVANVGTPGFKQEYLVLIDELKGKGNPARREETARLELQIDFRPGIVKQTGNPFDIALSGEGFFTVQTADGTAYTRKGDFTLDKDGFLITQTGDKVLGEGGPLQINGQVVNVEGDGSVVVDGVSLGKLNIVTFNNLQGMKRGAGGYYRTEEKAVRMDDPVVRQAHIELSNVNVIKEMVNMIDIQRTVESYQKLMQTISDEDRQATSRVGKLV
ncbi:MAG TPA: flagellar hook basal-body protein [Syntrophales bacterium]|nr:flagellar hook basal-body protein [Syntrophales bacterium]HOU78423.1 flagellar hook basal-body protein [Syntrophales bacterium]HQG35222.1 flagellar hook basal-body protein [Syntrophales bacterium]HQI35565.1 flagellar hook basal-body protein [Syntrophales bacterium]HQJ30412.1 flagellar hook basal-body protein [Syntrophales bacterium]